MKIIFPILNVLGILLIAPISMLNERICAYLAGKSVMNVRSTTEATQ